MENNLLPIPKGMKFEVFYRLNKDMFNEQEHKLIEKRYESFCFLYDVYKPFMEEVMPGLRELVFNQYPASKSMAEDEYFKRYIFIQNEDIAQKIVINIEKLPKHQKLKVDYKAKYPKLEEWNEFYCKPRQPELMKDSDRPGWIKDDAEWAAYRSLEDRRILAYDRWDKKRRDEFYEIIQPRLFNLIPELNDLDREYWISYATYLGDFYEMWKERMERLETVIENEMPPDMVYLSAAEFQPHYSQYHQKNYKRLETERKKRIFGDEYEKLKYRD